MANNVAITGEFPQNIAGTKQYGNNLKAFAAALSTVGMVGIFRKSGTLQPMTNCS